MKPTLRLRHFASAPSDSVADVGARHDHLAGRRPVDARDQVQQRRLAGARRPHQRDELALGHFQAQPVEDDDLLAVALVDLPHVLHVDRGHESSFDHSRSRGSRLEVGRTQSQLE